MEPLTLILTALAAGATAAAKETAGQAIKDAYNGLKALVQKRFAGKPEAEIALAKHEEKPKVWAEPLKEALTEVGAPEDETILKAAQELLRRVESEGAATTHVIFQEEAIGTHVGHHGTITVNMPGKEKAKED